MLNEIEMEKDLKVEGPRSVYVVLYRHGEVIKSKLERVCEIFGKNLFEIPDNLEKKKAELKLKVAEANNLIIATRNEIKRALMEVCKPMDNYPMSRLEFQKWYITKEKLLYQKMDMLRPANSLLQGICWCPTDRAKELQDIFEEMQKEKSRLIVKFVKLENHNLTPPTYLKTTEFIWAFQEIVSTYGVPRYREVNPAFFTIVTFPFLFGVMFGDICHGLVLFGFGAYMCYYKKELIKNNSMLVPLLKARYIFLLMGIFATFCGVIYNDFAGLNFNFFNSCYKEIKAENYDVKKADNCVYPIGLDPYWKYSQKQLQFENSLKMKLAVILGVIHMLMGVILKLVNASKFNKKYDIYFEFIPQVVFLLALFGFMDVLIFAKWLTNYDDKTSQPSYIITAVINMFLSFGNSSESETFIPGQKIISNILLVLIFLCVPIMLLPKPFLLKSENKKQNLSKKKPISVDGAELYIYYHLIDHNRTKL